MSEPDPGWVPPFPLPSGPGAPLRWRRHGRVWTVLESTWPGPVAAWDDARRIELTLSNTRFGGYRVAEYWIRTPTRPGYPLLNRREWRWRYSTAKALLFEWMDDLDAVVSP